MLSFVFHVLLLGSTAFPAAQPAVPGAVRAPLLCMSNGIEKRARDRDVPKVYYKL